MADISGPQGSTSYQIDVTEVTHGQYQAWLKTGPALTNMPEELCHWNDTYEMDYWCHTHYQVCTHKSDCDHHAAVCVDWCDAYSYCAAIGKRLCGAMGGNHLHATAQADATLSQWFRACSSGGINKYPYGNEHQPTACNGLATWEGIGPATTVAVGSPSTKDCSSNVIGYASVYDLSGSVAEWEDNCDAGSNPSHGEDICQLRGGSFDDLVDGTAGVDPLQCAVGVAATRAKFAENVGFRCCSP
jgi:formylglycine-generating enzyme required for sulfatase activity